jgi:hypothetical protein
MERIREKLLPLHVLRGFSLTHSGGNDVGDIKRMMF